MEERDSLGRFQKGHSCWNKVDPVIRFFNKIEFTEICWIWKGGLIRGYGSFAFTHTKTIRVHRFCYEILVGLIPRGLTLDHLCRNRACVNPGHLEPVTAGVNVLRGESFSAKNARKTHCIHGHLFDRANTYHFKKERGCRECRRISDLKHRMRRNL